MRILPVFCGPYLSLFLSISLPLSSVLALSFTMFPIESVLTDNQCQVCQIKGRKLSQQFYIAF